MHRTMPSAHTVAATEAIKRADSLAHAGEFQKSAFWLKLGESIQRRGGR